MSANRLTDRRIDALTRHVDGAFVNNTTTVSLAREIQERRRVEVATLARLRAALVDAREMHELEPSISFWEGRVSGLRLAIESLEELAAVPCVGCFLAGEHAPGCPTGQNGSPRYD